MRPHAFWGAAIGAMLAVGSCPLPTHAQPAGPQPAGPQPAAAQPAGPQPAGPQPAAAQPAGPQPAAAQPAGAQPTTAQPTAAQPAGAQSASAQPAAAQPTATTVSDLKSQGAAAAAAKEYEACARAYSAALAIETAHITAGELGLCEMALGWFVAAYYHLLYALEGDRPDLAGRSRGAWKRYRTALDYVDDRVARVILTVQPSRAEVFFDGVSVGTSASGRFFAVTPGTHTWTARLKGYKDDTIVQHGRGGDLPNVDLVLTPHPTPKAAPAAPAAAQRPSPALVSVPALEPPCEGAQGVRMSPEICRLFEELYRGRMEPTLLFIAGGLMSVGFTADVGPGFWLGGEARWRDKEEWGFSLGAEVRTLLPTKAGIRTNGKPMDVSLIALGIAPCARYRWVSGCVIIDPGLSIAGGPPPLTFPNSPILFMLGIGPRLAVDIPIVERFGARAFADLRISPLRRDLGYTNEGEITWDHPLVSGVFGVGVWFK